MVAVKLPVVAVRRGRQGVLHQDLYLWRRVGPPVGLHAFIDHLVSQKKKREVFIDATGGRGKDGVPTAQIWR